MTNAIAIFDIDGVIRDVGASYRRALADTVEHFTQQLTPQVYRPSQQDIDQLKSEGIWNNDWEASQELIYRHWELQGTPRTDLALDYETIVSFFQSRYRGTDPVNWNGYICDEPLLVSPEYFQQLTAADIGWGFFSGATRGSASYVLERRLGLSSPVLVAMEDAPGKPDPTGLFATLQQLENTSSTTPVFYLGDTVADMYVIEKARQSQPKRPWIAVGILPPHVQDNPSRQNAYAETLLTAGAAMVLENVEQLTPQRINELMA